MDIGFAIKTLNRWINTSHDTVFFGGAGVSTASGVPDFRSPTGIYAQEGGAERYLTQEFMETYPKRFYAFYRKYFMQKGLRPNTAHLKLAEMEKKGRLAAIVTQNVDGLHQKAGSRNVLELHGNGGRFYCPECGKQYSFEEADTATESGNAFCCTKKDCGGVVRPDIVLYGESLNGDVLSASIEAINPADLLIVGGSSLVVYPAAGLLRFQKPGSKLVLINLEETSYDHYADLAIHAPIGEVFAQMDIRPYNRQMD